MSTSKLRACPYCRQGWPHGRNHDLRSFAWLDPLPRNITVSNGDCFLHDGSRGFDRFLLLEAKMPWEIPLQLGQKLLLEGAARQRNWTVRIIQSVADKVHLYRVSATSGVDSRALLTTTRSIKDRVAAFLAGDDWREPDGELIGGQSPHVHGYTGYDADGIARCIADYHGRGPGCGDVLLRMAEASGELTGRHS